MHKSLIDSKIAKPLKTRVFAYKYIFLSCTGTLVKLTMNIYSSAILFLYIYAIIRNGCFRATYRHTHVAIARLSHPFPYIILIHKNTPYTAFIILRLYSPHKPRTQKMALFISFSARLHYLCIRQGCAQQSESKLSLRSLALSLHKTRLRSAI